MIKNSQIFSHLEIGLKKNYNLMQSWKLITDTLVTKNCLLFGNPSKLTSKRVAKYLLGTRDTLEVFKLYELRFLLLKVYPLIHNLFYNPRMNPKLKFQDIRNLDQKPASESLSHITSSRTPKKFSWPFKRRFSFSVKRKNTPPQVLFASITPTFSDIIYNAAQICNMPWHQKRWLSGSITAAISYPSDKLLWQYLQDLTQEKVFQVAFKQWGSNKENKEKIKEKIKYYSRSRWPSLLVIPDISNNAMILKEARKVGLPVMGLVNSNCFLEIDYPIFAQDQTLESIHFFCHFLAVLIAKETVFLQHKRYTLQKTLHQISVPKEVRETENQAKFEAKFTLKKAIEFQKRNAVWKKPFFFKIVRPWQKKFSKRYFLALHRHTYHPLVSRKLRYRKIKHKKNLPYKTVTTFIKQLCRRRNKNYVNLSNVVMKNQKFKEHKNQDSVWFSNKKYFPFVNQKLFQNEYGKKYFQKNRRTKDEKNSIQQKLRNFLWFSKMTRRWREYRRSIPKNIRFGTTPQYFRRSLKQWFQNVKWTNHRSLIKKLLFLKKAEKKDWSYRFGFSKKKYTPRRNKKNSLNTWEVWVTQNTTPNIPKPFKKKN